MFELKQVLFSLIILSLESTIAVELPANAEIKRTKNFSIEINVNCADSVNCDNVTGTGTNIHTGETLQLNGKKLKFSKSDSTPKRLVSYEFRDKDYTFVVTDSTLTVSCGNRVLLKESFIR